MGEKDVLGLYLGEHESASFWLQVLTDLQQRGVEDILSNYFKYPEPLCKLVYTTNTVEGYHRMVRKVTKSKGAFTSDMAVIKLV